jgi:hypothetical protein
MRKRPKWANVTSLPAAFWSLLASAGGRPRYREYCGGGEGSSYRQGQPRCPVAIAEQSDLGLYVVFRRYLLPSLLNVQFLVHDGTNPTQFGLDVTSRALCNSDLLATTGSNAPSLSLRFFTCLKGQLQSVFERLVRATTFVSCVATAKTLRTRGCCCCRRICCCNTECVLAVTSTSFGLKRMASLLVVVRAPPVRHCRCLHVASRVNRLCSRSRTKVACTRRLSRRFAARSVSRKASRRL